MTGKFALEKIVNKTNNNGLRFSESFDDAVRMRRLGGEVPLTALGLMLLWGVSGVAFPRYREGEDRSERLRKRIVLIDGTKLGT